MTSFMRARPFSLAYYHRVLIGLTLVCYVHPSHPSAPVGKTFYNQIKKAEAINLQFVRYPTMLWVVAGIVLFVYLVALSRRLESSNPTASTYAAKSCSEEELSKVTVPTVEEIVEAAKATGSATGKAYIVVGGAGLVGQHLARTLLARGETLVRIIDVIHPKFSGDPASPHHASHAEFVQADVTNYESIKEAISKPFGNTSRTAEVIFHTVAVIRHHERLPYVKHLSHMVNVQGTQNVLTAAQELGTVESFVFTSSAAIFVPPARYLHLGYENGMGPRNRVIFGDDIPEDAPWARNHYLDTKREADKLVRDADGIKGIRTGVIRPGMAITGPRDVWITLYFTNPGPNVVWGGSYLQSIVNPWDLARAHVQLADALSDQPQNVGGQGFAITGDSKAYSFGEARRMIQFFAHRNLGFQEAPALAMYTLSHILEVFFLGRYLLLKAISKVVDFQVSYVPNWAVKSKVALLQPTLWDLGFADVIIDDSRARKVLGYRNYWSTTQTIKWTVESLEERVNI